MIHEANDTIRVAAEIDGLAIARKKLLKKIKSRPYSFCASIWLTSTSALGPLTLGPSL